MERRKRNRGIDLDFRENLKEINKKQHNIKT